LSAFSPECAPWRTSGIIPNLGVHALIVVGVSVYAGAILVLFGKRWVMSLVRG
jgi:NADH:ubiquinone oxidoreductase subunit 6 (subunit J)